MISSVQVTLICYDIVLCIRGCIQFSPSLNVDTLKPRVYRVTVSCQEQRILKNLSLCKYLLWYIFSRTNPFADVSDKPIRDIELDLDAFSQAKPISKPACRSKPLIPAIIIHHHSPGPGTALSISCPLIPDTGSLQQPGCNPVHPPGISYQRAVLYCNTNCQNTSEALCGTAHAESS